MISDHDNQNLMNSEGLEVGQTQVNPASKFPNPFFDIGSVYVPRNLYQIFEWSEWLYLTFGTYRQAARKVVRYFLTDITLEGESQDEQEKYEDFLKNDLHLLTQLAQIGDDFSVYGNVFVSIYFPFDRFLICPTCQTRFHADTLKTRFQSKGAHYTGKCPKCAYEGAFERKDIRSTDRKKVKIIRWNPKIIRLRVHPISQHIEYYLEMDARLVEQIRSGNKFYLNDTPWPMVECACSDTRGGPCLFKFEDDAIYHLRESSLAGLPIKGWAIPPILANFKLAYYMAMLRRYDEAIALDFIMPFRMIFPAQNSPAGMGSDPIATMSMDVFYAKMKDMVDRKRKNMMDITICPFPVGYQMVGGEGKMLAPKESIAMAMDEFLNAMGYPAELYKGTLSIQAFPVALRLFEKTWGSLVDSYNDIIAWILRKVAKYYGWGEITGSLRSVTLADDLERKALQLQAAAGQDISKATAYRPLGIDYMDEQTKVLEEQKEIQKLQQEAMDESQAQQMGAGTEDQGGPGGTPGATPGDVYAQGKELANQLLTQTPETQRRGELIKIKNSNPTLHAIVIQELDNLRNQMASEGQAQVMQQAQQAGGYKQASASELPSVFTIQLLLADQLCSYSRQDFRKMAQDIQWGSKDNRKTARKAFSYVYRRAMGWE